MDSTKSVECNFAVNFHGNLRQESRNEIGIPFITLAAFPFPLDANRDTELSRGTFKGN